MDVVVLGHVTRSNNIYSYDVSGLYLKGALCYSVRSPSFSHKGCSWNIVVLRDHIGTFSAKLKRNEVDEGPEIIQVSFSLGFRWDSGAVAEDPPKLNWTFTRGSYGNPCMEDIKKTENLNMFSSKMTITCRFLEENVAQPEDLTNLNQEVDALKKKLNEAKSTVREQEKRIDELMKDKIPNFNEIENLKKAELNLNKGIDVLKMKLNEAQLTNSKLRVYMDGLIEDKRSNMREIENLKKLNKELELEVDALKKKYNEAQAVNSNLGKYIDSLIDGKKTFMNEIANLKKLNKELELDKALISDFWELLSNGNSPDVILEVQGKELPAYKMVLRARSPVFRAIFSHGFEEEKTGVVTIPDCDPESFPQFLSFLYSGRVGELTADTAQQLYATSDKYDVPTLKSICRDHLKHNLTPETVCDVAVLADLHSDDGLASAAQLYFNENYVSILLTAEWSATLENNSHVSDKLLKEMASGTRKKRKTSP